MTPDEFELRDIQAQVSALKAEIAKREESVDSVTRDELMDMSIEIDSLESQTIALESEIESQAKQIAALRDSLAQVWEIARRFEAQERAASGGAMFEEEDELYDN